MGTDDQDSLGIASTKKHDIAFGLPRPIIIGFDDALNT